MELICAEGLINFGIIDELTAVFNKMEYPNKVGSFEKTNGLLQIKILGFLNIFRLFKHVLIYFQRFL